MSKTVNSVAKETNPRDFTLLDPEKVLKTLHNLSLRISERFPESGLSRLCCELETACSRSHERIEWIAKPHLPLRILRYALIIGIVVGLGVAILAILNMGPDELEDLGHGVDPVLELFERQPTVSVPIRRLERAVRDVVVRARHEPPGRLPR